MIGETQKVELAEAVLTADPCVKLVALYEVGDDEAIVEAGKLSLEMIRETASWLKYPQDEVVKSTGQIRVWWLHEVEKGQGPAASRQLDERWTIAFAKARRARFMGKLQAANERMAEEREAKLAAEVAAAAPQSKPAEVETPAPDVIIGKALPGVRGWDEVAIPEGASELEGLTYVPGLVGDIVEWIVRGANRPNRMMALGVALAVVGTIMGRRVVGPTGSATHLYIVILAPSGSGKDYPLRAGKALMEAVGLGNLIGPDEFVSTQGIWRRLKRTPLLICFVDEMGDELSKINGQGNNAWVSAITGLLKKCYNAWEIAHTPEGAHGEESVRLPWVAVSLVGAATPEAFFDGLETGDLESGFVNRMLILPFEGHQRPKEQIPEPGADVPPKELVEALRRLPRQTRFTGSILDLPIDKDGKPILPLPDRLPPMPWGPEASEVYFGYSGRVDKFAEVDKQRFSLSQRGTENGVRLATNLAKTRFSPTLDRRDIEWGIKFAERSIEAGIGGIDKFMQEYYTFPKFCMKFIDKLRASNNWRSTRDLKRDFRNNMKTRFDFNNVAEHLIEEGRIIKATEPGGSRGSAIEGYALVVEPKPKPKTPPLKRSL